MQPTVEMIEISGGLATRLPAIETLTRRIRPGGALNSLTNTRPYPFAGQRSNQEYRTVLGF
jgi:hypothetical protein